MIENVTPPVAAGRPGDTGQLAPHEASRCRAAAGHARRIYPGPLGELVHRELIAHAEFGYRFSGDALIPQLVTAVLATPVPAPGTAAPATGERTPPMSDGTAPGVLPSLAPLPVGAGTGRLK